MVNKKNKKGITPVIALVMLMLVTVGIVGVSAAWFSGVLLTQTKKSISIPAGGAYCSGGEIKVFVLNNGYSAITASDILVAQVDGNDVLNTPFFGDMKSGLVGYWKFDEGSGAIATDSSGSGNNGNLQPACPDCPTRTSGKSLNAIKFDGVNDFVSMSHSPSLDLERTQSFSASAWAKIDITSGNNFPIIEKNSGGVIDRGISFTVRAATLIDLVLQGDSISNRIYWRAPLGITLSNWNHYAFTYDGSSDVAGVKVYVNGLQLSPTYTENTLTTSIKNIQPVRTGYGFAGSFAKGTIDEVKIYNKAIGDLNIQPSSSGLVINYPGLEGKHSVGIVTSSGAVETGVTCA
ncbi:MAG: LamG domain-containing protein [Candidatus Aenigmarchaeota archaeon]|nr:LamG domain-containing protein [Candidatus Aenigmarchaeota archaeon]